MSAEIPTEALQLRSLVRADQMLELSGAPRVVQGGMTTTARIMRLNRATGGKTTLGAMARSSRANCSGGVVRGKMPDGL